MQKNPATGKPWTLRQDKADDKRKGIPQGSPKDTRLDAARGVGAGNGKNWIKGAIKHPGALHKSLGVPQGQKIPTSKLNKAASSSNPTLARRANLAKTLKKMH